MTDRTATRAILHRLQTLTSDTATGAVLAELRTDLRRLDGDPDEMAGALTDASRLLRQARRASGEELDGLLTETERVLRRALS